MTAKSPSLAVFAVLGALSGAIATLSLFELSNWMRIEVLSWLELSPGSLAPGLIFGVIIGAALLWHGVVRPGQGLAYAFLSAVSYLAAETLAIQLTNIIERIWLIGMIAGLLGSACLTFSSAVFLNYKRRTRSYAAMLAVGCLLGGLLELPVLADNGLWEWMLFFVLWQSGYAMAMAMALADTTGPR